MEVPIKLKETSYKVPAICISHINIDIELDGISSIAKNFIAKGYELADPNLVWSNRINNLDFVLGTKSSYI